MAYEPLTKEQFAKARAAGFSPEKIVEMEKVRKAKDEAIPANPDYGLIGNALTGIVKAPVKLGMEAVDIGRGAYSLGKSLFQKATGQDDAALKTLQDEQARINKVNTQGVNVPILGNIKPDQNPLQAAGTGLDIASNIPIFKGAGIGIDLLKGATKEGGMTLLKRAAVPLAKEGAIAGAMTSGGQSLQDGDSFLNTVANTVGGAIGGGILAPLLGVGSAVIGHGLGKYTDVGKLFKGDYLPLTKEQLAKQSDKAQKTTLQIIRGAPETVEKKALEEIGTPRIGKEGLFRGADIAPSIEEKGMIDAAQPLVENGLLKAGMQKSEKQAVLRQTVAQLDQGLKEMIAKPQNNIPFKTDELIRNLEAMKGKNRILFGSDKAALDAYDATINEFLTHVKSNNVEGLLNGRQSFDKWIRQNYPKAFAEDAVTGSTNPRFQALRDARDVANNMAADLLDRAQIQKITKVLEPKQAKTLIAKAKNFKNKQDFIKYAKQNISDFPESGFVFGSKRKMQKAQNTPNQYVTTREQDLGELWDIANIQIHPQTGQLYTDTLRKESNLIKIMENIAETSKGISTAGGKILRIGSGKRATQIKRLAAGAAVTAGALGIGSYYGSRGSSSSGGN